MDILLGCGHCKERRIYPVKREWLDLVTVDINPDCKPDVEWDLNNIPLPFDDNSADEIHAYEVLEHIGKQGDYKFFFNQFEDFWRILKPNGLFVATTPSWKSMWAWGDPGHTRVFNEGTIGFLEKYPDSEYQLTKRTDYRGIYKGNLKSLACVYDSNERDGMFTFVLQAIK